MLDLDASAPVVAAVFISWLWFASILRRVLDHAPCHPCSIYFQNLNFSQMKSYPAPEARISCRLPSNAAESLDPVAALFSAHFGKLRETSFHPNLEPISQFLHFLTVSLAFDRDLQ